MSTTTGWRALPAVLAVLGLLATGCAPAQESRPEPERTVQVDYTGAVGRLAALGPGEAGQQVQDWARLSLASSLGMSVDAVLDATYDSTVLRDDSLDGLVEQPVASGRSLFDARSGTLHLLVPATDRFPQRTIAGLLDDQRADRGSDPARVRVHNYTVDGAQRRVRIEQGPTEPTARVREQNGWMQRRIDDPDSLAAFVSAADQLTRVEVRGAETWAQGWDFAGMDAPVTAEDVAVLARGYANPTGELPGFSLDPGPRPTGDDLRAVLTGVPPPVVQALLTGDYAGSGFASAAELRDGVQDVLFGGEPPRAGLPNDRTVLWAIQQHLSGLPVYSQARYDGGIAGTEVGNTLFYTDFVAKNWTSGVGSGVPYRKVPGFVPDSRAQTPPGLCPARGDLDRSGRLWFGQHDAAFSYGPQGVSIGRQATRLYARADGPNNVETESDYQFGRGLGWWDTNFEAVADYDHQYRRLEQLMRWSGALDWLALSNHPMPETAAPPESSGSFASWYSERGDLRERAPLPVVDPPSARTEAVLAEPSAAYRDCGVQQILGGVSLGDISARGGIPPSAPLPPALSRARAADPAGTRVDANGDGQISRRPEQSATSSRPTTYTLRHSDGNGGPASSRVTAGAGQAVRSGDGRLVTDGGRSHEQVFRGDGPNYSIDVTTQGASDGRVTVLRDGNAVRVSYLPGVRELLGKVAGLFSKSKNKEPSTDGIVRYDYGVQGGRIFRVDDGTAAATVATGNPSPDAFRVDSTVEYRDATGATQRLSVGAPRNPGPEYLASLGAPSAPRSTTYGQLRSALPPGAAVYVTDSASFPPGTISPGLPVRYRVRPAEDARPGSSNPAPSQNLRLAARSTVTGKQGTGGGGPPLRLPPVVGGTVVTVTLCPENDEQLTPQQREECGQ